ncbi:MAG: hypothetical protein E6Q97_33395 [Desulfurellales bacterium]|nr:MAG: hypothetical protein E6Q97_33395 [Desulfurellales bacterium]
MSANGENIAKPGINPKIEAFLTANTRLEIEFDFGFSEFNRYLEDVALVQSGVPYAELGISERRASFRPLIIASDASAYRLTDDVFYESDTKPGSIALLKLSGVMRTEGGISNPGIEGLANQLRAAYANDNIAGIILETRSGGGESLSGSLLKSVLSERNKPVIGFAHIAASAAYRALSGTDEIIASSDAAEFGSIGTFYTIDEKTLSEYRERFKDFYGSNAPNKNGAFRAMLGGDYSKIQKEADELTARFHEEIAKDRPLQGSAAKIADTLGGGMFDARDAKKRGLIDGIGNLQYALKRLEALKPKYKKKMG